MTTLHRPTRRPPVRAVAIACALLAVAGCEAVPADHALGREVGQSVRRAPRRLDLHTLFADPARWAPLNGFPVFQDLRQGITRLPATLGLDREPLPSASDPARATGAAVGRRESLFERIVSRLPL